MVWRGIQGDTPDQGLWYARDDGSGWSAQQAFGAGYGSEVSPALAGFRGRLYLAWRGVEDDQGLWWASYPDPTRNPPFTASQPLPHKASSRGPSLAAFDGRLFMAWRGIVGDEHLWWATSDGQSWSDQILLGDRISDDSPVLIPFGQHLYMIWRGGNSIDEHNFTLYSSVYLGGDQWSPQVPMVNTAGHTIGSESRPGCAAFNDTLFLASVGAPTSAPQGGGGGGGDPQPPEASDPQIYIETFDGTTTTGHIATPQQTDYEPSLNALHDDHYSGIWEQRDDALAAAHNIDGDEYQRQFDAHLAEGYRLVHINAHSRDGVDIYSALWRIIEGPGWTGSHRLDRDQHQQLFTDLVAKGYRPVQVCGYAINDIDHYAAIWEQRPGPPLVARHALTGDEYQQAFEEYLAQGYRLVDVSGYCVAGQDLYTGIWEQRDGPPWQGRHRLTSVQHQQTFEELTAQGFRPLHVHGYAVNGQNLYASIWEQSSAPPSEAHHLLTPDEYQQTFHDLLSRGLQPICVSGY
jgi:hypothetical protein